MMERSIGPRCDGNDEGARVAVNIAHGRLCVVVTLPRERVGNDRSPLCRDGFEGQERAAGMHERGRDDREVVRGQRGAET